ncbi:MAG: RNA-binding protein [Candidatus Omnitrophota bacterium]
MFRGKKEVSGEKKKVYVGNLLYNLAESDLRRSFEGAGVTVISVEIIRDRQTGRSKGFAFVEVDSDRAIEKAISQLDGKDLKGRKLRISKATKPRGGFRRNPRRRRS